MAEDLKLISSDISVTDGDLTLVSEGEEVAQSAEIRIYTIKGEWLFDDNLGVPWWDGMFTIQTSYDQKIAEIKKQVINTPDVTQIKSFSFAIDPVAHTGLIEFEAQTSFSDIEVSLET